MRLYTICAHETPVLVMNANVETTLAEQLNRRTRAISDGVPDELERMSEAMEIEKALDTWLREDLQSLRHDNRLLWNGCREALSVREATADETERWHNSRRHAVNKAEHDGRDENWLIYVLSGSDDPECHHELLSVLCNGTRKDSIALS